MRWTTYDLAGILTAMAILSRSEAQRRADEIRTFQRELDALEREGVLALDAGQRAALARHHARLLAQYASDFDIDRDAQGKQLSLGMRVASFFGALALGASVFFLFYQFWGLFPTAAQVGTLIAAALGSFLATVWIQGKDASGYFAKLGAMVAFACFVLNVVMLGGIFDIRPSDKAFIVWAAYGFLLAYAFDLRLLLAAAILCFIAFVAARTGTVSGMYWLHFGERPENFFPAAALLFAVPVFVSHRRFPDFPAVYRVFALLALFLPILVLCNWGRLSYLDFDPRFIEGAYQLAGFGGTAAAVWLGARKGWGDMVNTGVTLFVIFLYTKLFDWWWDVMPKYLFFLVLGLTAVLLLFVLRRLRGARRGATGAAS
jgi:uncharacterized membrane protein